ncbi:Aldo/keto reductase [Penicillium malachiteum]|uniref:Aldo/keto reductase n=1 Tax=Penicillium malachiteum TaxID=1324776 RepID=UPI002547F786|nr:Aldo/keto reductase [Penicillium malachiteum]KAJ5713911.1 Aldo/keto reductase [Penicillium malachiteum]
MSLPCLSLSDGNSIPMLGFGTGTAWFKEDPGEPFNLKLVEVLKTAIQRGFRHIDCSDIYGTEEEVGIAIKECGVARKELFITTKVLEGLYGIPTAIESSLSKLQLDYADLYLIHSRSIAKDLSDLGQAWLAMEKVQALGKAKPIGVANHQRSHLEEILKVATITPAINPLEFHPYLQRSHYENYLCWMREQGIEVASFNDLTPTRKARPGPLNQPLAEIAAKYGITENAILIKWQIDQNVVPVTTTSNTSRLSEYLAALDLMLTVEEMEEIAQIGLTHHFRAWAPDRVDPDDRS